LLLAFYDYWAVYKTRHMVYLFQGLAERGLFMAFILPKKFKGFFVSARKITIGGDYVFLGTGDIVLPLAFAMSAGAFVGTIVLNLSLIKMNKRQAVPALPPIVFFSILGYLASKMF
jgi:presenilin-like A22 family membrane protease